MVKKILKTMDYSILICTMILLLISLFALFSATQNSNYVEFKKQVIWLRVSIPIMIVIVAIDYETIAKISPILYIISILSLIIVLFTSSTNGASSWFNIGSISIQPAEFAKIIV